MARSIVAALHVRPETILEDIDRLLQLARVREALQPGSTTILKDNISWHFPFPGANTTPWQLEGTIRGLRNAGFQDLSCVQNKTVVTNAFKGEDLNRYVPIFKAYDIPVLYNFKDEDMKWVVYKPKASMRVLDHIFPDGITVPDYFFGKNIVHLPTMKCVAGDSELMLADGSVRTIREVVAEQLHRAPTETTTEDGDTRVFGSVELMAMDETGEVRPFTATAFWRTSRGGRTMIRMRTRTGRTLVATGDHPIWTPEGWRSLDELRPGSKVAVARRLRTESSSQVLPQVTWVEPDVPVVARAGRVFARADRDGRCVPEIARLRMLASQDLAWDTVEEAAEIQFEDEDLYDLTVPGASSFVANGIVVHNCHIYTTTTGAMKNAFGGLLNTKRHYTHSWIHETLVDLLAIQKEIHTGLFAVMDGTTAGNGPGPRTMFPVVKNWMLASADQVAIDALAAKMMGFDPMSLDYIRLAHEKGLGCGDTRDIEVVGDQVALHESWGFRVGDNGASRIGDLLWFSPLKRFQNFFFRTPLVNVFIMGSEVYHDYYRWPARDRTVFEKWRRETTWGKLFQDYEKQGVLAPGEKPVR